MSTLTIVEGQGIGVQAGGQAQQAMALPFITIQRVTFTGTAGYGAALNKNTTLIYVKADAAASLLMGTVSSASVTSLTGFPLASGEGQYFSVAAGSAINFPSVVQIG